MISMNKIAITARRFLEATTKARMNSAKAMVNTTLLGMGREQVEELGYSYEALLLGPSAWPWQKMTQDSAISIGNAYGTVIELKERTSGKIESSSNKGNPLVQGIFLDHSGINQDDQSAA